MSKYTLNTNISELSGVGKTREKQLNKLGIFTLYDLLYLFPRAYERRGEVSQLVFAEKDTTASFVLTVSTPVRNAMIRKGLTVSKFKAFDESGAANIVFFNSPYVKDIFYPGAEFRFYGKVTYSREGVQLTNPKYEPILPGKPLEDLIPVYPCSEGINSKFINKLCKTVFTDILSEISDPLPDKIRIDNSLPALSYALKNVHFPESDTALKKALTRLAFDEMLLFGLGVSLSKRYKTDVQGFRFNPCELSPVLSLLPYELTDSQKAAVNDIYKDTVLPSSDNNPPMSRILVGDVGCGKTVCALMAMYIAAKSGYQAALMAPTEILARQHYNDLNAYFEKLGIKTELLIGATTQKEKRRIYGELKDGEIQVVIGTHALLTEIVEFSNLGIVITDEQHRFGIAQRAVLREKASAAHLLVMSATPIPRTLALAMYGDLDISRITEMPKGRQRVDTFVVDESYRDRLNAFITKQVENGGQCYVVCPAIERSVEDDAEETYSPTSITNISFERNDFSNVKNASEHAEFLRQNLKNVTVECMHGRMKSAEKDEIMKRFASGETKVLVSTTVIEVGVNVPNATLMIIENAERFGLSQLHQLRGRVGRGTKKSYCVLVSGLDSEKAKSRLEIMKTTYDGYEIAEKDLILRGPGDFFASSDSSMRQSGGFEFKLAKLCDDETLFSRAFALAKAIVDADPELTSEENRGLRKALGTHIKSTLSTIS